MADGTGSLIQDREQRVHPLVNAGERLTQSATAVGTMLGVGYHGFTIAAGDQATTQAAPDCPILRDAGHAAKGDKWKRAVETRRFFLDSTARMVSNGDRTSRA